MKLEIDLGKRIEKAREVLKSDFWHQVLVLDIKEEFGSVQSNRPNLQQYSETH